MFEGLKNNKRIEDIDTTYAGRIEVLYDVSEGHDGKTFKLYFDRNLTTNQDLETVVSHTVDTIIEGNMRGTFNLDSLEDMARITAMSINKKQLDENLNKINAATLTCDWFNRVGATTIDNTHAKIIESNTKVITDMVRKHIKCDTSMLNSITIGVDPYNPSTVRYIVKSTKHNQSSNLYIASATDPQTLIPVIVAHINGDGFGDIEIDTTTDEGKRQLYTYLIAPNQDAIDELMEVCDFNWYICICLHGEIESQKHHLQTVCNEYNANLGKDAAGLEAYRLEISTTDTISDIATIHCAFLPGFVSTIIVEYKLHDGLTYDDQLRHLRLNFPLALAEEIREYRNTFKHAFEAVYIRSGEYPPIIRVLLNLIRSGAFGTVSYNIDGSITDNITNK